MLVLRANPEVTGAQKQRGRAKCRSGGKGASTESPRLHRAPGGGFSLELRIAIGAYTLGDISATPA